MCVAGVWPQLSQGQPLPARLWGSALTPYVDGSLLGSSRGKASTLVRKLCFYYSFPHLVAIFQTGPFSFAFFSKG